MHVEKMTDFFLSRNILLFFLNNAHGKKLSAVARTSVEDSKLPALIWQQKIQQGM